MSVEFIFAVNFSSQAISFFMFLLSALIFESSTAEIITGFKRTVSKANFLFSLSSSSLERLSKSSTIKLSLSVCLAIISRNRFASSGLSIAPSWSVSTNPLIDVIGVFSSCETFATKSRLTSSISLRTFASSANSAESGIGNLWLICPEAKPCAAFVICSIGRLSLLETIQLTAAAQTVMIKPVHRIFL